MAAELEELVALAERAVGTVEDLLALGPAAQPEDLRAALATAVAAQQLLLRAQLEELAHLRAQVSALTPPKIRH